MHTHGYVRPPSEQIPWAQYAPPSRAIRPAAPSRQAKRASRYTALAALRYLQPLLVSVAAPKLRPQAQNTTRQSCTPSLANA